MVRVCLTGSNNYENQKKIKEVLYRLKRNYKDEVQVITCGSGFGADKYVKYTAFDFEMNYAEFPPYHQHYNMYCIQEPFRFNKPYSNKNYYIRNLALIDFVDYFIIFKKSNEEVRILDDLKEHAEKKSKKVKIIID